MKYDEVLQNVGEFGRYQKWIYSLLMLPSMTVGAATMMVIVAVYTPHHRCKLPGYENDTFEVQSEEHALLVNMSIPASSDPTLKYDKCNIYNLEDEGNLRHINATTVQCQEWVYDKSIFHETFSTKINLVCGNAMMASHIQMSVFFGVFIGAFVLGNAADMFGRKTSFYFSMIVMTLSCFASAWAPEIYSFASLQFVIGASSHGAFLCMAVFGMEIVGPAKRSVTGMVIEMFFAVGSCYLALMSFLLRTYFWINLSVSVPAVIFVTYWWLIPESPRWLLSKGKRKEAVKVIRKLAKVNKVDFPEQMYAINDHAKSSDETDGRIWQVFRSGVLCKRTAILAFNWMVVSMTYYGVTMNAGNMAGDFYLNFFLVNLAEIPGLMIGLALLNRIGRRWANGGSMIIGGLACIATVPTVLLGSTELQPLTLTLALIGKAGAASAFGIVYIFTAELLPTVIRNSAMGTCSCAARIGGMLAPYIAKSGELIGGRFGQIEPLVVFGALSIVAGLLLFLLPETLNLKLPDTIKEGEQFGRKNLQPNIKEIEIPFVNDNKNDETKDV